MKGIRGVFIGGVSLWIGAILQQALSHRLGIWMARPDFLLVVLSCLCLFASRAGGAFVGFFAGLAAGATSGANLSQYIFSRTITGFCDSWARSLGLDSNAVVAMINAFAVTVFAQLILMFFAPPPGIASFLGATIASAMVNGVLALPVFLLLRRIIGPQGS